jgi:hypothetical protein
MANEYPKMIYPDGSFGAGVVVNSKDEEAKYGKSEDKADKKEVKLLDDNKDSK